MRELCGGNRMTSHEHQLNNFSVSLILYVCAIEQPYVDVTCAIYLIISIFLDAICPPAAAAAAARIFWLPLFFLCHFVGALVFYLIHKNTKI